MYSTISRLLIFDDGLNVRRIFQVLFSVLTNLTDILRKRMTSQIARSNIQTLFASALCSIVCQLLVAEKEKRVKRADMPGDRFRLVPSLFRGPLAVM